LEWTKCWKDVSLKEASANRESKNGSPHAIIGICEAGNLRPKEQAFMHCGRKEILLLISLSNNETLPMKLRWFDGAMQARPSIETVSFRRGGMKIIGVPTRTYVCTRAGIVIANCQITYLNFSHHKKKGKIACSVEACNVTQVAISAKRQRQPQQLKSGTLRLHQLSFDRNTIASSLLPLTTCKPKVLSRFLRYV
jgi:hypothetical protein